MINLLSPKARKTLTREYWLRVLTVWGFLLSGLCIVLSLLLIPTYVLVHSQLVSLTEEDKKNDEIEIKYKAAESKILEANSLIETLSKSISYVSMSTILNALNDARTPATQFKAISFERTIGVVDSVQLQGEARTRADLILLKSTLERSPFFENVTVPISDLARDVDLPFVITISLKSITK